MDRRPYWQASSGDPHRSRRIERMTVALTRLRQIDDAYVIFEARSRPDRYIQFANRRGGSAADHAEISVAAPLPVLASAVPVGTSGRAPTLVPSDQEPRWISVGPFYGEPDHEPLAWLGQLCCERGIADRLLVLRPGETRELGRPNGG